MSPVPPRTLKQMAVMNRIPTSAAIHGIHRSRSNPDDWRPVILCKGMEPFSDMKLSLPRLDILLCHGMTTVHREQFCGVLPDVLERDEREAALRYLSPLCG